MPGPGVPCLHRRRQCEHGMGVGSRCKCMGKHETVVVDCPDDARHAEWITVEAGLARVKAEADKAEQRYQRQAAIVQKEREKEGELNYDRIQKMLAVFRYEEEHGLD